MPSGRSSGSAARRRRTGPSIAKLTQLTLESRPHPRRIPRSPRHLAPGAGSHRSDPRRAGRGAGDPAGLADGTARPAWGRRARDRADRRRNRPRIFLRSRDRGSAAGRGRDSRRVRSACAIGLVFQRGAPTGRGLPVQARAGAGHRLRRLRGPRQALHGRIAATILVMFVAPLRQRAPLAREP